MTDDQQPDDVPYETVRDVLASTGDRPTPEFVTALRSTLTDAAAGRTTAPVEPAESPSRRRLPFLAAAAVIALVVSGVAVLALQDGDGEIATTPPTSEPIDTTTASPGSTPDHPTTAEQLTAWVGIRLNGVGNGAVNGDYPWFVIESVDTETGAIRMSGNDGCNDWWARGTILDGRFQYIDGASDNAECETPGFAPRPDDLFAVSADGIDIERDGNVHPFGPDPVDEAPAVAAFADLVGDQLVVIGPEYGPAVQLRIERVTGNVLRVDGIDECNGYSGDVTIDATGSIAALDIGINLNDCSGPPSSGALKIGDVLRPSADGLTIGRDGVEFRLVSLDGIGAVTDPGEIDALGEIRIRGRRAQFGEQGVVEVDGCELAWEIDETGTVVAPFGGPEAPNCAHAEPEAIAHELQVRGVTFHRSPDGLWVRSLNRQSAARVVVAPRPGTPLDAPEGHVGLRFVDLDGTLPSGALPWIEIDWLTDDRVRLTLDVGCGSEQLDLVLAGDEVAEVVRGPAWDGGSPCQNSALPTVGDRFVLTDGVEIRRDDSAQRFTWIDAVPRSTDPVAGSYLLNGERITFRDGTVSWGLCTQRSTPVDHGVVAFPFEDDPESCGTQDPPSRLYELRDLLFGGITVRPAGDDLIIERHGLAARLVPDAAGAPTPFDLQGFWRLIGWIDPPQTTSVEPYFALSEQEAGYYITLFDGCSQIALQATIDAGVITDLDLVHGPPSCPDTDVPFEPVTFRVGDRFQVDGSSLRVVAPDGTVRYLFDSTSGTILSPTIEDLAGADGARSWRPAGSDARPLRFFVGADGTLRVEYGSCSSPMLRDPGFRMPEWPVDSTCFDDATWIERAVARALGFAATTSRNDPFRIAGAELQIHGEHLIRLEPVP